MTKPATLDDVFAEARRRDFRLNNFFQAEDGMFRCNWVAGGEGRRFGLNKDPVRAAVQALEYARDELEAEDDEDLIG